VKGYDFFKTTTFCKQNIFLSPFSHFCELLPCTDKKAEKGKKGQKELKISNNAQQYMF
jgi:hypothetical protein